MSVIRAIVLAGAFGWLLIALNFAASMFIRALTPKGRMLGGIRLRLTWCLAAVGAAAFLLSRLQVLPYGLRVFLDAALAIGGVVLFVAMAVTLSVRGWEVLK